MKNVSIPGDGIGMTWNYRIVRKKTDLAAWNEVWYAIHEAYYDEEGNISYLTTEGIDPGGATIEELLKDMQMMTQAFSKPVIDYKTREEI